MSSRSGGLWEGVDTLCHLLRISVTIWAIQLRNFLHLIFLASAVNGAELLRTTVAF